MSITLVNRGLWERDTGGNKTTNISKAIGDQGTVRVVYEGIEYVFGPGETKSFSDEGIAAGIVAANSAIAIADTREGFRTNGRM